VLFGYFCRFSSIRATLDRLMGLGRRNRESSAGRISTEEMLATIRARSGSATS
jgi:hypothetical protein